MAAVCRRWDWPGEDMLLNAALLEICVGKLMSVRDKQFRCFLLKHFADDGLKVVLVGHGDFLSGVKEEGGQDQRQSDSQG